MKNISMGILLVMAIECGLMSAQTLSGNSTVAPPIAAVKTNIPYLDAKPIFEALPKDLLPSELRAQTPAGLESAWPAWVARRDVTIRARLERGDEDSIVNFLLFGTTFTKLPRATERDLLELAGRPSRAASPFVGRIEDLAAGIASPGTNERMQFARQVVEGKGINPGTAAGKNQVRHYLDESLMRVSAELVSDSRAIRSAMLRNDPRAELLETATLFRDRGLSSDTSIDIDFAIERALEAIKAKGMLGAGRVRRVAIVGPGLDFTDKREGYDFYPPQTIQPFAVIDSLIRLGLAKPDGLRMTTFDLSQRVNQHLEAARQRARAGSAYTLALPRNMDLPWTPSLVSYWERFGDGIGEEARPIAAPPSAGSVQVRAVRVRPAVVMSTIPQDLNIVLQRLEPLAADERFDLIIATNVLIYYDAFEGSLAVANVANMLRPGGFFLSNNAFLELPTTPIGSVGYTDVFYTQLPGIGQTGDRLVWYRRQ